MTGQQAALPASSFFTVSDAIEYGSEWPISGDATTIREASREDVTVGEPS